MNITITWRAILRLLCLVYVGVAAFTWWTGGARVELYIITSYWLWSLQAHATPAQSKAAG